MIASVFFTTGLNAQTELRPGDLAVLGVNANLTGCGLGDVDLVSFVCFRDITPGTVIDITDNGWERAVAGKWGNAEGFISVRRTGGTIPAGTVITFRLPPAGQSNSYTAVSPDAAWTFTQLSFSTLNFNSNGDQLYFMQGGEWDPGNADPGNPRHDATYVGGVILFGFNTKPEWRNLANSSQDSGLHPDVEPCYRMESAATTNFFSYSGPVTPAGQLEWINRIAEPDNWSSYADCRSYVPPPAMISLITADIDLACTVCTGCDTVQEKLRFKLPESGGPFIVVYSDGSNQYTVNGLNNADTVEAEVTKTTVFTIVSVQDAGGCPVYSNFGPGDTVTVSLPPIAAERAALTACDDRSGRGVFNLSSLDSTVSLSSGDPVRWFVDSALAQPIDSPSAYQSAAGTVYAVVGSGVCTAGPVPVALSLSMGPVAEAVVERGISCSNFADAQVRVVVSGGVAPYRTDWSDDTYDNQLNPVNVAAGDYLIRVTDSLGCIDSVRITLSDPTPLNLSCLQQKPVSQVDAKDGQAVISINGGGVPYQLSLNGPVIGERTLAGAGAVTLDSLAAGNYDLTIVDGNGCTQNCSFTIGDPLCTLSLNLAKQDVSCSGLADGAIDLTISGGKAPFEIDWGGDPLNGIEDPADLPAGNYTVVVTDSAGCTATGNILIGSTFPALAFSVSPGGPVCPGECYGFIFSLQGTAPFTLSYEVISGGAPMQRTFTTNNRRDQLEFCPADFGNATDTVSIRFISIADANCRKSLDQTERILRLREPETTLSQTLCAGDSLVVNGVVYHAGNPSGREVLSGGSVSGCDSIVNINLRFFEAGALLIDSTLCSGESITINGRLYDEGNPSGREVIKGGAASGCDSIITINLRYVPPVTASLVGGGEICLGDSTQLIFRLSGAARADIQYSDGVNPPIRLNDISDGHTIQVAPVATSTYRIDLILIDSTACPPDVTGTATVTVREFSVSLEAEGVTCPGLTDGRLRATLSGGNGPFTYAWSTGDHSEAIGQLAPGSYSLTVTDAGGCTASDSLTLAEPDSIALLVDAVNPTCPNDKDGALVLEAIDGGAPPYAYSLNGSTTKEVGQIPFFIRDIGSGAYTLLIRDAKGCESTQSFTLDAGPLLELDAGADTIIRRGDSLTLSLQANFSIDSIVWSPPTGLSDTRSATPVARPVASTTYLVTAFDPKGCRVSDRIAITIDERSRIFIPNAFSPDDDGINDYFVLFARADDVQSYTLRIFDRWGGIVYERDQMAANTESDGWDGTARGRPAHPGVYVYYVEILYRDGSLERRSGEVLLVR